MTKSSFKGAFALTLASFLWGIAFIAQSDAADKLSAESFICFRFLLGALVLLPVIALIDRREGKPLCGLLTRFTEPRLLKSGILCGLILFSASYLQQASLIHGTTSGKCAFLTALYMIFVPIAGLFFGKKASPLIWVGIFMGAVGMYLLCIVGTMTLALSDALVLLSALFYTAHILVVDFVAEQVDCIRLSCLQFLTAGILGGIVTCFTGFPPLAVTANAAISILYVGIFSSGVAYTLQIVGQKYCAAAIAPVLMSLESVFAALAGWVLLNESLTTPQLLGCTLIFAAVLLLQLPPGLLSKKKS